MSQTTEKRQPNERIGEWANGRMSEWANIRRFANSQIVDHPQKKGLDSPLEIDNGIGLEVDSRPIFRSGASVTSIEEIRNRFRLSIRSFAHLLICKFLIHLDRTSANS